MLAYRVTAFDMAPRLENVASPDPAPGEVALRIEACGLNYADLLLLGGKYQDTPPLPFVPGLEVCGRVERTGDGVDLALGTRVAVYGGQGGLAEMGCFPAARCRPVPDEMPSKIAAGFQIAYGTSHLALAHRARIKPGERLVVLGAAGGVGLTAVELGVQLGAEVVAVARGAEKLEIARAAGAHHLIEPGDDLVDQLRAIGRADVVYDPVGGAMAEAAFRAMAPLGRYLVIGFASGDIPRLRLNHAMVKNIDLIGLYWGAYLNFAPDVLSDSIADLMQWYVDGRLKPHISHCLPLTQVEDALDLLRTRKATGKVVVCP